jgi:hypothetical protein
MTSRTFRAWLAGLAVLCAALPTIAGQTQTISGPPAPIAPSVISRDDDGRATVRAFRLTQPLRLDGQLDEPFYRDVPSMSDFIQMEPRNGAPATERTEAWLFFDDDNVYVSVRCWDTDPDSIIATEMRRDSNFMFGGNDVVLFLFDTFYDRLNSVAFTVNPLGGRQDGQVTNERIYNGDWNPVWSVQAGRFEEGWSFEAAVPFKSLRYNSGGIDQVWGFNVMRIKRSKNEVTAITKLPAFRGSAGFQLTSFSATAVGMQVPRGSRSLDVKPYVTSNASADRTPAAISPNDLRLNGGVDVKYGVTQNLAADLTYRTDFAQVEADEQQINLTRFTLFFPEKREFFLENQGTFSFGGVPLQGNNAATNVAPILFYSRRVGLNGNREVPLDVGGRLTGRIGRYSVGAVAMRTGEDDRSGTPPTTFSVLRLRRDILARSSVGLIYTGRSEASFGPGSNHAYGADGTFTFFDFLFLNAYWARTQDAVTTAAPGREVDRTSYRGQLDYNSDRYGLQLERIGIGSDFRPDVGLVRRAGIVRDHALGRFSPRPKRQGAIRKYFAQGSIDYIENTAGVLESRERATELALEFQNADRVSVGYADFLETLTTPLFVSGVTLPVGSYEFEAVRAGYNMGQQRAVSANISLEHGTFYNGRKTTVNVARGRALITNQLSVEPTYSINKVDLVQGRFTTHLFGTRATYTATPLMFVSALMQYNSTTRTVSTNARFRWEYLPGSELFLVYNEDRNTLVQDRSSLSGRSFIVKMNRLFRF